MREKILIVDDDRELRQELKEALREYEVIEAADAAEAVKRLSRANEIGVVLLDVMMPRALGTDVLREIKKKDPEMGVIILTGHSSKEVAVEALKGRADDYVEKPADIRELKRVIENILDRRKEKMGVEINTLQGKIEKVKRFVQMNRYKKTTLNEAAEAVCLSPKYLSRVFKEQVKKGFNEFRLQIKIDEAKKLLRNTALNINQVADKLGYENTESFIRIFHKFTRISPAKFRSREKKKKR